MLHDSAADTASSASTASRADGAEPTGTTSEPASLNGSGPRLDTSLGLVLGALSFVIGARVISDNSFLTHFTTGDLIRTSGSVPTTDPYSYTAAGDDWTVQSWFASLVYSVTNQTLGGGGLRLLNGVLTAALVAAVWKLSDGAQSLIGRLATTGVVVTIGATMWTPRPLLFGLLGIGVVMLVLDRRISPLWLLPMLWVWVNSHGSFPFAGVLVVAAAIGAWLDDRKLPEFELRVLGWAVLGMLLGAINPLGPRLLVFPVELLGKRDALEGVAEWAPPKFDRPVDWLFAVMVIAVVYSMSRRMPWRLTIPAAVFAAAGFSASRNIGVAAIVAAPVVAMAFGAIRSNLDGAERFVLARAIAALSVAAMAFTGLQLFGGGALNLERFPVDATTYMVDHDLVGNDDDRILQRDTVGNYLHYRLGLDARVFVDDRFDFYPDDVLTDHLALVRGGDDVDFSEIVERRDPTAILWHAESPLGEWLQDSDAWLIVYEDDNYLVATPA